MIWATWRQCRTTLVSALTVIGVLILVAIGAGFQVRGTGSEAFGVFCDGYNQNQNCIPETALTITTLITVALPVLLGILVGVTVFSRDIDRGTHVLGLSQSVSRVRWYSMRVLVIFVPITGAMTLLGLVLGWTRVRPLFYARFDFPMFETSGTVVGAYTFLALMIGSTAALILRNTVGSMVLTLIVMVAILIGLPNGVRQHYASPNIDVQSIEDQDLRGVGVSGISTAYGFSSYLSTNRPSWIIGTDFVDAGGSVVDVDYSGCPATQSGYEIEPIPDETNEQYDARTDAADTVQNRILSTCIRAQGADHVEIRYFPDTEFWRFQATETVLMLLLAALMYLLARRSLRFARGV